MKKSFVSMLSVTMILILIVVSSFASVNVKAQENPETPDIGTDTVTVPYKPDYRECDISHYETRILDAVYEQNQSLLAYDVRELGYLGCSYRWDEQDESQEDMYFYGSLELRDQEGEIRYQSVHFSGTIINDEVSVTYISEPWTNYNFSAYFTEDEEMKIGYYLKQKLVDIEVYGEEDKTVWMQVSYWPQYRCLGVEIDESGTDTAKDQEAAAEIARCIPNPEEMDFEEFEANFQALVAEVGPEDSFYYKDQWSAMGLVKMPYSRARELLRDWVTSVSFFGEELKFNFYGNATVSADIDDMIGTLESQGFTVCDPWDSSCGYKDDRMAWLNPERFGFYAYKEYGENAYFSVNLNGAIGEKATLYAYMGGYDTEPYMEDAKSMVLEVAGVLGIDVGDVEFTEETFPPKEPILLGETEVDYDSEITDSSEPVAEPGDIGSSSSGSTPSSDDMIERPQEGEWHRLTFEASVVIPDMDYDEVFAGWEKEEGMFYTSYRNDNMGVTIGEPYIYYWQQTGDYDYDSVQISGNLVYTSVIIDEPDFEKAIAELNDKISPLATVTGEWNLEYSPTGQGGWGPIYVLGGMAEARSLEAGAGAMVMDEANGNALPHAPQAPSFDDSFGQAYETMKSEVSSVSIAPTSDMTIIGIITVLIVSSMAGFIFFLLK